VLDAHADHAFEEGDGVFGDELLEGDEEASLDGNTTGYSGCSGAGVSREFERGKGG